MKMIRITRGHLRSRDKDGGHTIWSAIGYPHRLIYSMLDAVPPIHAESSHVATDKGPLQVPVYF